MTAPVIRPFPPAPSRLNDPQTFIERADPTIAHLQVFVPEANAAVEYVERKALEAAASAIASAESQAAAVQASVQSSAAAASAAADRAACEAALDEFTDAYLGLKTADPLTDNDGNELVPGAFYVNAMQGFIRVYTSQGWIQSIATRIRVKRRAGDFVEVR
jgi:hypothetical protein